MPRAMERLCSMFVATENHGECREYRFRKLSALIRRFGGDSYRLVKDGTEHNPTVTIHVLKYVREGYGSVRATLRVPSEALEEQG